MIRLHNWISLMMPSKAEEDEGATSSTLLSKQKIKIETQPSSVYETPRSFNEEIFHADKQIMMISPRNKIIPLHLTPPVTNCCGADSCTTSPKLKRSARHHLDLVKVATREKEALFSISMSPLSSLENSLGSRCGSVTTPSNDTHGTSNDIYTTLKQTDQQCKRGQSKRQRELSFTRQRTNSIMEHLGKSQKGFKRSMKAWKRERKEKNSSSVNGNEKELLSQRSPPFLDSRPLLLLMKKVKEKQHRKSQFDDHHHSNQLIASGINILPQSSKGKENILFMDELGNFVDNIDRTSSEDEPMIASIVKVGVGDHGCTGERQKKTKMVSSSRFECSTLLTPNNATDKKVSFLKKSGKKNNSASDITMTANDKIIDSHTLASGVGGVGHLYAEQQRRIHQLNMQLLEKEKLIDLLQQQLSEAKREIENSIDFYAMSVIKLEGNIIAMSEEHELELARLKEQVSALSNKRSPERITRQNQSQQEVVNQYKKAQNRPSSAPNGTIRSHNYY
jgi:hypothetical protein